MPTVTNNGETYELLATPPNWATPPEWTLQWQRLVTTALSGKEDRADYRRMPKAVFQWTVSRSEPLEWAELEKSIALALKAGRAAVPLWTRPSEILANSGGTTLTLDPTGLLWKANDLDDVARSYVAFADGPAGLVRTVTAFTPLTGEVTLNASVPDGSTALYPVLFGRLEVEKDSLQTDTCADLTLRLVVNEWLILIGPLVFSAAFTVLAGGAVVDREFYFSHLPISGGELYPMTRDGELLPAEVYFYSASASAPESGADLVSFTDGGTARQAWAKPL